MSDEQINAQVVWVHPDEKKKPLFRIGCKYLANGFCNKCGREHTLTFDEWQLSLKERSE
jgi:hypothetical protein